MKKIYLSLLTLAFAGAVNAQDSCAEALVISAGLHTVDTVDGTEIPLPICAANGLGASNGEWYMYQPADTFNLVVTSDLIQNSGGDTRFHVYSGECGNLVCVAGDDDGGDVGNGYLSFAEFDVYPEIVYFIAFDDHWNPNGFDFEIIENEFVPPPPPVPTLFSFTPAGYTSSGTLRGAVDMDGDHLDDIVSIEGNTVNLAIQTDEGLVPSSIPTVNADNSPSWSMAAGDVDGNGWNDLVYGGGSGACIMFRSDDGESFDQQISDEDFEEGFYLFSQRSNMVDMNNDGNLDVFVCHDVEPNTYFVNQGDGTMEFFQGGLGDIDGGGNYGSIWTDFDNDGDIDMFIAKCRGSSEIISINEMHRNNGDGTFTEVADEIGLADPIQTWSSAWGDFDNDGDMDVFVGASSFQFGGHKFMMNMGDGTFSDITVGTGMEDFEGTSIEWVTHDFDNDGYLDIMGGGGNILKNNGDMTFTVSEVDFWNGPVGDLNNDGFLDVVSSGSQVQYNDGNENNYLVVTPVGTESNVNAIGTRITVYSESFTQIREIRSGDGFRYMSSLNAYFGLGQDEAVDSVMISYPSGNVDMIYDPEISGAPLFITEGESDPLSLENEIQSSLTVYPNPAINELFIDASENLVGSRVDIFDVQGKRVQSGVLNSNRVDVSTLETGNYILQIVLGDVAVESKFYKK